MASLAQLRSLNVILTAECNLRCSYCYQNAKKPLSMPWETLRAALDMARRSDQHEVGVYFLGGEPLLEFPLMRRAVEYLEKDRAAGKHFHYGISTNGTLLTDEICAFLDAHRFETQISFDGVSELQESRGRGTFAVLDRLLDRLRDFYASFYRWNVKTTVTMGPRGVPHLADSIEYFLSKGIQRIAIMPSIIPDSIWETKSIEDLDEQFARIYESSLRRWQEKREVSLMVFKNKYDDSPGAQPGDSMCGIVHGGGLVVDVDGQAYGCTVHASSYQEIHSPFLRMCLGKMQMGAIGDEGFAARYAAFPDAARSTGLFHNKGRKHSAYGQCGECRHLGRCSVCPTSIGHIPGNSDPDRVPDFYCAYNLVSLKYRERFPSRPRPRELLRGPTGLAAEMERWAAHAEAVRSIGKG